MTSTVRFQYTRFIDMQADGTDGEVKYGYRVFDDYGQYCNDKYTWEGVTEITPEDVVMIIENEYNDLYELILDNGFYFNGVWVAVDETGIIIEEEM